MNITLQKNDSAGGGYTADCTDLAGSPPVGTGSTKVNAIIALFFRLAANGYRLSNPIYVNGKPWKDSARMQRR